mmetsp:Transcript_14514/g.38304  ORF Transcript_14514/g.38304 Transcript_14514/m.38304 type:complete len:229 (+) Transcript_14514:251-937(+)
MTREAGQPSRRSRTIPRSRSSRPSFRRCSLPAETSRARPTSTLWRSGCWTRSSSLAAPPAPPSATWASRTGPSSRPWRRSAGRSTGKDSRTSAARWSSARCCSLPRRRAGPPCGRPGWRCSAAVAAHSRRRRPSPTPPGRRTPRGGRRPSRGGAAGLAPREAPPRRRQSAAAGCFRRPSRQWTGPWRRSAARPRGPSGPGWPRSSATQPGRPGSTGCPGKKHASEGPT